MVYKAIEFEALGSRHWAFVRMPGTASILLLGSPSREAVICAAND